MKNTLLLSVALLLMVTACQKDYESLELNQSVGQNEAELYEEVASLLGYSSYSAFETASWVKNDADRFNTVYFKDFSEPQTKVKHSIEPLLIGQIESTPEKYPQIMKHLDLTKSNDSLKLDSVPVEVYMPNRSHFNPSEENDVTIISDPVVRDDWASGYRYYRDGGVEFIPVVDEKYAEEHMTIIILPLDTTEYTKPLTRDELEHMGKPLTKSEVDDHLLRESKHSSEIPEGDILYTTIENIRVDGKSWCGFISNKLKLAIYRASSEVTRLSDGSYEANGTTCFKPTLIEISKDDLEHGGKWLNDAYIFDDNWQMHEQEEVVYFVSEHNTGGSADTKKFTIKVGLKDGKITSDPGISMEGSLTFRSHSKLRVNQTLNRDVILTTNLDNMGQGKLSVDGTEFAIRRYGLVELVYAMRWYHE